ncbi:MAG TPA: CxxxxCH/CxxCH domain-containing protein [Polyangiaceae bacterium]|nr:CxxxxCH/CxxCH domain-containing protein [Polyangiaceae bacterium]
MNDRLPAILASLGSWLTALTSCLALWGSLLCGSCLERRASVEDTSEVRRCAQCHGDPKRVGDYLERSAPPNDLRSAAASDSPGVGAHSIHLRDSETHSALACTECHVVPTRVEDVGHADTPLPAELNFGPLASKDGRQPTYDPASRTCSNTWCHRSADAVWTAPHDSEQACGSCHGLPPEKPHPQSERCFACHAEVIDEARHIVAPKLHVDGIVQYQAGPCSSCHGRGKASAPPLDTQGNSSPSSRGVGAHEAHLSGGSNARPLECSECHHVPERIDEPTHADGLPAEVSLIGVAQSHDFSARWQPSEARCSDTWCHGPTATTSRSSPRWDQPQTLDCTGCHGMPPAAPHPAATQCGFCHSAVVSSDHLTIHDRNRHVDGTVDVAVGNSCTGCHGSTDAASAIQAAPPRDLMGGTEPSSRGVGAHSIHLNGTENSRPVPCETCHVVPTRVLAEGHLDGEPPDVVFSGLASAFGAAPKYIEGRCADTACHGAFFPEGHRSGGSRTTPEWTNPRSSEAACGSCHSLPPPRPHPYAENSPDCSSCHENVAPDNRSFVRPDLHVDGVVTFTLPQNSSGP